MYNSKTTGQWEEGEECRLMGLCVMKAEWRRNKASKRMLEGVTVTPSILYVNQNVNQKKKSK